MSTGKEKLARWAFLDKLLSQGKYMSLEDIMKAYHQNPIIRIEPKSDYEREHVLDFYLPSLRKDLDKFKNTLKKKKSRHA